MKLFEIVAELANTSSRNGKQDILRKYADNEDLKFILKATYDPFRRYNINTKLDNGPSQGIYDLDCSVLKTILDDLCSRKISGNEAANVVNTYLNYLDEDSASLVRRIIRKDLRAGFSDSTINSVYGDLVPSFDVQLAAAPARLKKMVWPAIIEPKYDGMRCIVIYDGETVEFLSRGGRPIGTLEYMVDEIVKFANGKPIVLDSEVMSSDFNETISSVKRKTAKDTNSRLYVFDVVPYEDFASGECNLTQETRKGMLKEVFASCTEAPKFLIESKWRIAINAKEAKEIYASYREQGFEGAIVKKMEAPYLFKRNDAWVKMKPLETTDAEIIGFKEGTGKYEGCLGSFVVDVNGIDCNIGGGYSDKERFEFWEKRNEMIGTIIECEYMEATTNKEGTSRLRHGNFIKIRSIAGAKC